VLDQRGQFLQAAVGFAHPVSTSGGKNVVARAELI